MAEIKQYVDLNLQSQQLVDANLTRAGIQTVANAAGLSSLTTTLQGLVETKRVFVIQSDTLTLYIWDGGGATGAFQASSGSAVTGAMTFRGGLDQASTVISTTTITDGSLTYGSVKTGDTFIFNGVGGTATLPANIGNHIVESGDQLIFRGTTAGATATNGELTTAANWTVLQNNVSAATTTTLGLAREATTSQVNAGVSGAPTPAFVTPETLALRTATDTRTGIVELATDAETQTGTDTARAITPANLTARTATETRTGIVELATDAETQTGTDTARAITPANLTARTATETRTGIAELATQAETNTGTDDARIVTPLKLKTTDKARVFRFNGNLTANTPQNIAHNFTTNGVITNQEDLLIQCYRAGEQISLAIAIVDGDNITVESNPALTGVTVVIRAMTT